MSATPLLLAPERCERCQRTPPCFLDTVQGRMCIGCWRRKGEPTAVPGTMAQEQAALEAARDSMNRRGGAHRHLVRKGLT